LESLVTPEPKGFEAVFPGENWFFYWKTSPSLWETKLSEYSGVNPIFVPIYWALHSEYSDQFDFGQYKPETDLLKLCKCAQSVGRELVFFIQLTPLPFLINGGIPSYLARNLSQNKEKMAISVVDSSKRINRIYSFYNPKIFQAYRKFAYHLGQYFSQLGITSHVYGLEAYRFEEDHLVSYFKDHSNVFEGGFSRYLSQMEENKSIDINELKNDHIKLNNAKNSYSEIIKNLYLDAAKESLSKNWVSQFKVGLLGGSSADIFRRSFEAWESEKEYFKPLFKNITNKVYPCSLLLEPELKSRSLGKALQDIVTNSFSQDHLNQNFYNDDLDLSFRPMNFFELFDEGEGHFSFEQAMDKSGLKYYFDREFPWAYKISKKLPKDFDELDTESVLFFFGHRLNQERFNQVLKLFMAGMKIFIDVSEMSQKLIDKLDVFFIENSIETQKVNYLSPVTHAELAEGVILTYDSKKLSENSLIKRIGFWDKMIGYLNIKHLNVETSDEVEFFWSARSSSSYELNYEQIRRVCFYNPTSYKRKAHVNSTSNFAFIKTVDQKNAEVKSTPIGIDITLLPGASVTLDFGYYEE
jgi:hypothetical protein